MEWTLHPPVDALELRVGVGMPSPGFEGTDDFWAILTLKDLRDDAIAMARLRGMLAEELGSVCLIRMTDEQVFAQAARLLRQGRIRGTASVEKRGAATASGPAKAAPPPPPPRPKPPARPAPPPPASVSAAVTIGPAAAARIEAAASGVPFWICCEACGY